MSNAATRGGRPDHGGHSSHHDHFGNPKDLRAYLARLEGKARDAWQKPSRVIQELALKPGQTVAEIGAGPGYFTMRLARAVGKKGRVLAAEVEPRMIAILRERIEKARVTNITPILASQHDPHLPANLVDVLLMVNTFHHFPSGKAYLRALMACLRPGGRLVNIDFHDVDLPVGPPVQLKISRSYFLATARKAGFALAAEHTFLPYQYFLELQAKRPRSGEYCSD